MEKKRDSCSTLLEPIVVSFSQGDVAGHVHGYIWQGKIGTIRSVGTTPHNDAKAYRMAIARAEDAFLRKGCVKVRIFVQESQNFEKELLLNECGYGLEEKLYLYENASLDSMPEPEGTTPVREFEAKDLQGVIDVENSCFPESWQQDEEGFLTCVGKTRLRFTVAELGGRVAGYAQLSFQGTNGRLGRVAVLPEFRRRGIASALIRDGIGWLLHEGGKLLTLRTPETDIPAQKLYEKLGFRRTGREFDLGKNIGSTIEPGIVTFLQEPQE